MKVIKATQQMLETRTLVLGFQGENLRTQLRIDCSPTFAEYPNATPALAVKPSSGETYPVFVERDGNEVVWDIVANNLALKGDGELQLTFYKDNVIAKTYVGHIRVNRSLQIDGEMPDVVATWVENANRKLAEVDAQIVELEGMVDTATDAATRAEQSASTASTAAEQAAGSAATATEKATEATNAAGTATAKAAEAALSATQANNSAVSAADSERIATAKAVDATTAATTATAKAEQATEAAQTATEKAGDASASARAAQTSATDAASSATAASASETAAKASETAAGASATQAAQSAQTASTAAQTATQKAGEAATSATNAAASATSAATSAETASTKAEEAAQSAQAVAETAEQLADSLEQIAQNTQDIADHEQYAEATYAKKTDLYKKADVIKNTASGAIASFPDGADGHPIDELTVQIEPVQDLHEYDHPWPAGGGKNLVDTDALINTTGTGYNKYGWKNILKNNTTYTFSVYGDNTYGYRLMAGHEMIAVPQPNIGVSIGYIKAGNRSVFTTPSDIEDWEYLFLGGSASGAGQGNNTFMVELGENLTPTYAPYSNICPITGFDGLTVTRTGKNLLQTPYYDGSKTEYGVTFTVNNDGSVSLSGTNNRGNTIYYGFVKRNFPKKLKKGSYSVGRTGIAGATFNIFSVSADNTQVDALARATETSDKVFTLSEDTLYYSYLAINAGTTVNATFYPRLELGTTATAYEPYQGATLPITFPSEAGTVYGGSLTIAEDGSGVLTVDRAMVDLGTLTWYKIATTGSHWRFWAYLNDMAYGGEMLSSQYKHITATQSYMGEIGIASQSSGGNYLAMVTDERFSDADTFKTAVSGVQLVYELANPIIYNLTVSEITTLLGANNLWHDANGEITVGYKANTKLYIDGKIAELVAQIVNS